MYIYAAEMHYPLKLHPPRKRSPMKKIIMATALLVQIFSSVSFADQHLVCTFAKNEGLDGQTESLTITKKDGKYSLKTKYRPIVAALVGVSEAEQDLAQIGEDIPGQKTFVLSKGEDGTVVNTLVVNFKHKQAAYVFNYPQVAMQFMNCK